MTYDTSLHGKGVSAATLLYLPVSSSSGFLNNNMSLDLIGTL